MVQELCACTARMHRRRAQKIRVFPPEKGKYFARRSVSALRRNLDARPIAVSGGAQEIP
jgi:hypothetical protein